MEISQIVSRQSLEAYLADDWMHSGRAIALRLALRTLPAIENAEPGWLANEAIVMFRALLIASLKLRDYYQDNQKTVHSALLKLYDPGFTPKGLVHGPARASAIAALTSSFTADSSVTSLAGQAAEQFALYYGEMAWPVIQFDCQLLADFNERLQPLEAAAGMSSFRLWQDVLPNNWMDSWTNLRSRLFEIDSNFVVWTIWFERRLPGQESAFDIPGDKGRVEDKEILRRLAEATDEDFWGKGHEYVNATLKGWLDEARARVAPPIPEIDADIGVPSQEPGAIAYGVNNDGMLDRLPPSDQHHLRDLPNQRRAYADLRETALELREEGQRLGPRLQPRIERAVASLPERFEDAEAWPVWRDFNALRRLYQAHRKVENSLDPDPARLEAAVAEGLGSLLDLFNNFAFADDGLRAKDENRIPPQERDDLAIEAQAARPIVEAILSSSEIATDLALADIAAEADDEILPSDDVYSAQALDQSNRIKRNWVAGLFSGLGKALDNPKLVGFRFGKGVVEGAGKAVGVATVGAAVGYHGPILEFVATNAVILSEYVAIAYSSFPNLPDLIAQAKQLWQSIKSKA